MNYIEIQSKQNQSNMQTTLATLEPRIYKINGIEITDLYKGKNKNYRYIECVSEILQEELENLRNFEISPTEESLVAGDATLRMAICLGVLDTSDCDYMMGGVKRAFTVAEQTIIGKYIERELFLQKKIAENTLSDVVITRVYYDGIRFG